MLEEKLCNNNEFLAEKEKKQTMKFFPWLIFIILASSFLLWLTSYLAKGN
jgi:hypothetical protein